MFRDRVVGKVFPNINIQIVLINENVRSVEAVKFVVRKQCGSTGDARKALEDMSVIIGIASENKSTSMTAVTPSSSIRKPYRNQQYSSYIPLYIP